MEETVSPITVNRSTPRVHKEPQDDSLSGACQVAEVTSDRHGFHRLRLIFDFLLPEVGTQKKDWEHRRDFFSNRIARAAVSSE